MIKSLRRVILVMGVVIGIVLGTVTPSYAVSEASSGTVDTFGNVVVYASWRYHAKGEATWRTTSMGGCGGYASMYQRGPDGGQRTNWLTLGLPADGARNFLRNDTLTNSWILGAGSYASNAKGTGYGCPNYVFSFTGIITI